jgi:glycerophosphoryl diester phosphodiesterase
MKSVLKYQVLIAFIPVVLFCCQTSSPRYTIKNTFPAFYKEGHRGTRGLMPENTIASMKKAVDDGANMIEVDIQISKDGQVMVAHDAHINRQISLLPDGSEIPEEDATRYVLHQMPYNDIRRFDVGSKYHPDFPQQKKMKAYIPLLGELIDSVERHTSAKKLVPVIYNIEIKARPDEDGFYQPVPATLIAMVMEVVNRAGIGNRFYIQSFDIRQIQEVRKNYPHVVTGFLTSSKTASFEENISAIGFEPEIYSPHYKLATPELVAKCHMRGIKFVPWTVNTLEEINALKKIGVDGIITDYPNLLP